MGRLSHRAYDYIMGCLSSKVGPDAKTNHDSGPNENGSSVKHSCAGRNTPQIEKDHKIIRGDITQKNEARKAREEMLRKKQLRITSAAADLSHRIMEERDRLSLNSRSHTASRATSRTGSPSQQKKHVTFLTISAPASSTTDSDKTAIKRTPTT